MVESRAYPLFRWSFKYGIESCSCFLSMFFCVFTNRNTRIHLFELTAANIVVQLTSVKH